MFPGGALSGVENFAWPVCYCLTLNLSHAQPCNKPSTEHKFNFVEVSWFDRLAR